MNINFSKYTDLLCEKNLRSTFGDKLTEDIKKFGYPDTFSIWWPTGDLNFYGLCDINNAQKGYDFPINLEHAIGNDKVVLSDRGGDPIVIDKNRNIYFALHGMGTWRFEKISSNLVQFLYLLSRIILLYHVKYSREILDDDFELRSDIKEEILTILYKELTVLEAEAFFTFFYT